MIKFVRMAVRPINAICLTVTWLALAWIYLMEFNPMGLGQRLVFGQRPPYHWETEDQSYLKGFYSPRFLYVGSNGKSCATIYRDAESSWRVYGFGFSESYLNPYDAMMKAKKECR